MLGPPLTPSPLIDNWMERHRHRGSFVLHILGIPFSIVGLLLLPIAVPTLSLGTLGLSVALFVLGYLLQFLGHALEGTEPGEIMLLRRRFSAARGQSRPVVATGVSLPGSR